MAFRTGKPFLRGLGLALGLAGFSGAAGAQAGMARERQARPEDFGVQSDTVTVITAWGFQPDTDDYLIPASGSLGRYCNACTVDPVDYYAPLDLPAGAVIDYVGVNNQTDTNSVMSFTLWQRHDDGSLDSLYTYSLPAHAGAWETDFGSTSGILIPDHEGKTLILDVHQAPNPNYQFFGWVEVWWRRSVKPAPATASFADVPTTHPFFQFIEALKASGITGGCGNGNYCPGDPVTRGQMAVFLAKALGLHWPN